MFRRTATVMFAAGSLMLSAGCGGHSGASTPSSAAAAEPIATGASPDKAMAAFYAQKLSWKRCDEGECASLRVPIDYAKPNGPTIDLAVNRMKATGTRRGALVVNPGGPGGSGVDYAAHADQIVSSSVRKSYDVVGFDPRGVQRSAAITCVDDATLDDILGVDSSPETKAEESTLMATNKRFADACKIHAGPLLAHVSTAEAAKDLDVLRAALGEKKLNYLGKSYGTYLGALYADQFPRNVGRMVLDGVLPPDLSMSDINKGQAEGFEKALDSYLAHCTRSSSCPVGQDPAAGKKKLTTWLGGLDKTVVRAGGDSRLDRLTEGWASNGVADGLYDERSWDTLTKALGSAMRGDGTQLLAMGREYAERNSDGTYDGNIMQVLDAVTCLDRPAPTGGQATYEKQAKDFARTAPTWGAQLAWGAASCADWPVKATGTPHRVKAAGSEPIVVIGTTRDPATPYEWSKRLADQLENGRLVTRDGDGHTGYGRGNSCVDRAVDDYLVDGTAPARTTSC